MHSLQALQRISQSKINRDSRTLKGRASALFPFCPGYRYHGPRRKAQGARSLQAQGRKAQNKAAGLSNRDPRAQDRPQDDRAAPDHPEIKNRSRSLALFTKKKRGPPSSVYAIFQVTLVGRYIYLVAFCYLQLIQNTTSSQTMCTSGTPPPCLFSTVAAKHFFR